MSVRQQGSWDMWLFSYPFTLLLSPDQSVVSHMIEALFPPGVDYKALQLLGHDGGDRVPLVAARHHSQLESGV